MGIYHADDMSGIILTSFQRHVRGQPLEVETQVKHYRKYWKDLGVDPRGSFGELPGISEDLTCRDRQARKANR